MSPLGKPKSSMNWFQFAVCSALHILMFSALFKNLKEIVLFSLEKSYKNMESPFQNICFIQELLLLGYRLCLDFLLLADLREEIKSATKTTLHLLRCGRLGMFLNIQPNGCYKDFGLSWLFVKESSPWTPVLCQITYPSWLPGSSELLCQTLCI